MKVKATWKGTVIAESDKCQEVEGNYYFPPDSVNRNLLSDSPTTSFCGWKGTAHYYNIQLEGETNQDAAWVYPEPKPEAVNIKGYVAFWKGVEVKAE